MEIEQVSLLPPNKENNKLVAEKEGALIDKEKFVKNITTTLRGNNTNEVEITLDKIENLPFKNKLTTLDTITTNGFLGKGGEGKVYNGRWKKVLPVAVKVINHPYITQSLLHHLDLIMNITYVYCISHYAVAYDTTSCNLYILMEKMDCSLWDLVIREKKVISLPEKVKILSQISIGMYYLHSLQPPILHLDLKLENILCNIGKDQNPTDIKLCDFGLSQFKTESMVFDSHFGTLRAICPEMMRREECSEKSDVYSFGKSIIL